MTESKGAAQEAQETERGGQAAQAIKAQTAAQAQAVKAAAVTEARAEARKTNDEAGPTVGAAAIMTDPDLWQRATQVATVGLFVIALLWAAYVAQPVLVPVILAWVIATITLPVVKFLESYKIPRGMAAILVTIALMLVIVGLLLLLSTPMTYWLSRASELGALIKSKLQTMNQPLNLLDEVRKALNLITLGDQSGAAPAAAVKVEESATTVVSTIFSVLTPAVSQFILFVGALAFYLVYQTRIRSSLVHFLKHRESRLATLHTLTEIDENMTVYFGTFTIVNFCLGLVTVALTWFAGLPNPLLWGVLAAVLNYIPYLGAATMVATLGVVGLVALPTVPEALVAPALYLGLTALEGQFITPMLMGHRLTLNPFAVFLSIAFCTWLWGPIGAFLAVPMLMAVTVMLANALTEEKPDLPQ